LLLAIVWCFAAANLIASQTVSADQTTVLLVIGAAGEAEFGSNFVQQAAAWKEAAAKGDAHLTTLGLDDHGTVTDYSRVKTFLEQEPKTGPGQFWLVLLGHGTFDGKEARFNLRGPDLSATELAAWLQPFRRPLAIINASSSSAPFLNKLSGTNRVVITATRSGNEHNLTRFGGYFVQAFTDLDADLDKDDQVSLLEAFLFGSGKTAEFYKVDGRLASEHALLDDNGDALGTPADWFRGLRAVRKAQEKTTVDGLLASQFHLVANQLEASWPPTARSKRDSLERAVFSLREKKSQMEEGEYYRQLERLLLELARLYESLGTNGVSSTQKPASEADQRGLTKRRIL
jgi:hypothetical protein